MYAQLVGRFSVQNAPVYNVGWTEIRWTSNEAQADRFPQVIALDVVEKLEKGMPGPKYFAERDSSGVSNLAPYGLDNWVVRMEPEGENPPL
jgi:hypothetical protein